jgi:hypothetical protein
MAWRCHCNQVGRQAARLRCLGQLGLGGSSGNLLPNHAAYIVQSRLPTPRGLPTAESRPNLPTPAIASTPPEAPRGGRT